MIYINNFSKKTKYFKLENISLTIRENRIYGFTGEEDKLLLLDALAGHIKSYRGNIYSDKQPATDVQLSEHICLISDFRKSNPLYHMTLQQITQQFRNLNSYFHKAYCLNLLPQFGFDPRTPYKLLLDTEKSVFRALLAFCTAAPLIILPIDEGSALRNDLLRFIRDSYYKSPQTIILSAQNYESITPYITDIVIFKDHKIILDDNLYHLSNNGYRITNYYPKEKDILYEETSDQTTYSIYNFLSSAELQQIKQSGGQVEQLSSLEVIKLLVKKNDARNKIFIEK